MMYCYIATADGGSQSTNTVDLQACPVPSKKVVATVLPVGDERVQQPRKKVYCVTVGSSL